MFIKTKLRRNITEIFQMPLQSVSGGIFTFGTQCVLKVMFRVRPLPLLDPPLLCLDHVFTVMCNIMCGEFHPTTLKN